MTKGRRRFRLDMGMTRLETWAVTASQTDKNAVYKALFSVSDGSIFRTHKVLDDVHRAREFFIVIKNDLVIKICFHETDAFGILYIGPISAVRELEELDIDKSA